jgi:Glyoxalase-like domain
LPTCWEDSCLSEAAAGLEVDHAFIGCTSGAPEGDALLRLGFVEGSGNTHLGQGTANRRFYFDNFMLELVWVADPGEAQSERTRRTRLWERCEGKHNQVSPFGIIFRSTGTPPAPPPFATWPYTPMYLPPGLAMQVAEGTSLEEPELFYLPFLRRGATQRPEPKSHALPIRRIRGLAVGLHRDILSAASRCAEQHRLVSYFEAPQPLLEIVFEGPPGTRIDVRPELPLVFRSA